MQYSNSGECLKKMRTSYTNPSEDFKIDITKITSGNFIDGEFFENSKSSIKNQVEVEILKGSKDDIEKLLLYIYNLII